MKRFPDYKLQSTVCSLSMVQTRPCLIHLPAIRAAPSLSRIYQNTLIHSMCRYYINGCFSQTSIYPRVIYWTDQDTDSPTHGINMYNITSTKNINLVSQGLGSVSVSGVTFDWLSGNLIRYGVFVIDPLTN